MQNLNRTPKPKTMDISYRSATLDDTEALKKLGLMAYRSYADQLSDEHAKEIIDALQSDQLWTQLIGVATSFLCMFDKRIVGMAFLFPSGNPWKMFPAEWSYIRAVGVHPEFLGRQIATTLTKQCIEYAVATGEATIALHTSEEMPAARHIYEKLGFIMQREVAGIAGKKYRLYTMSLKSADMK